MVVKQLLARIALHLALLTALLHGSALAQTAPELEPRCAPAPEPAVTEDNDLRNQITGVAEGLYSYRYQEHAFITKQMVGSEMKYFFTTIFNLGALPGRAANTALSVRVSRDGGTTWGSEGAGDAIAIANSNGGSLSDAFLLGGGLTIAHSFNNGSSIHKLYFSNLNWMNTEMTWGFDTQGVYTAVDPDPIDPDRFLAVQRPTVVKDKSASGGRWWATYVEDDVVTGKDEFGGTINDNHTIKMLYYKTTPNTTTDPGAQNAWRLIDPNFPTSADEPKDYFGTRNFSETKSARLIVLPDRVGLLYTDGSCTSTSTSCAPEYLKWSYHLNTDSVVGGNTIWSTPEVLLDSDNLPLDFNAANDVPADTGDPFGSHFTTAVDQQDNIHVVTRRGGRMVYLRYIASTNSWELNAPRTVGGQQKLYRFLTRENDEVGEYPQITLREPVTEGGDAKVRIIYEQKVPDKVLCVQKSVNGYGAPETGTTGFIIEGESIDNDLMVTVGTESYPKYPGNPRLETPSYLNGFRVDGVSVIPFLRQYDEYDEPGGSIISKTAVNYQFVLP